MWNISRIQGGNSPAICWNNSQKFLEKALNLKNSKTWWKKSINPSSSSSKECSEWRVESHQPPEIYQERKEIKFTFCNWERYFANYWFFCLSVCVVASPVCFSVWKSINNFVLMPGICTFGGWKWVSEWLVVYRVPLTAVSVYHLQYYEARFVSFRVSIFVTWQKAIFIFVALFLTKTRMRMEVTAFFVYIIWTFP